jgi:hypothetical protein
MSYDVFVQRFRAGGPADADVALLQRMLVPSMLQPAVNGFAALSTADGGADCYGIDSGSLMVNHCEGDEIWDLLVAVAEAGGLTIVAHGLPTCITDPAQVAELPTALRDDVAVVRSGADLRRLVRLAEG